MARLSRLVVPGYPHHVTAGPVLERYGDFAGFLDSAEEDEMVFRALRQSETTGGPPWCRAMDCGVGKTYIKNPQAQKTRPKKEI